MRLSAKFRGVSSIALTADSYRNVSGRDILDVTAHGVNANFEVCVAHIGVKEIKGPQTTAVLKNEIMAIACAQFPSNRMMISSVVTDAGSNFRAARSAVTDDSVGCAAHLIQLVVRGFTGSRDGALDEVLHKVTAFSCSFPDRKGFVEELDTVRVCRGKRVLNPMLPVVTRWNSDYLMVQRYLKLHKYCPVELRATGWAGDPMPTDEEAVREIVETTLPDDCAFMRGPISDPVEIASTCV